MTRSFFIIWRTLLFPSYLHILCSIVALLCCIPILFPYICPAKTETIVIKYAGIALTTAAIVSVLFMIVSVVTHMMRLSNTRAFSQLFKWAGIWSGAGSIYILIAVAADVPPPAPTDNKHPFQASDTLYPARDILNGPASLVIPIEPGKRDADRVALTPVLSELEAHHGEILKLYLENSPRWTGQNDDDTFYTKPGHLVMVPPTSGGTPALVHVCFRALVEGDPLPQGFIVVTPGSPFPEPLSDNAQIPDIALDLGKNHFLLLAWRGSTHRETAFRAINAAITATDDRMQPLLESPTRETVRRMLNGRESYPGTTPEFRLSEPLAQDGAYQAEIYANPGEQGTILVYVKELESNKTLRLLNCPARFSEKRDELFRHDIPGSMPHWIRSSTQDDISNVFPHNTPLFAIKLGSQRQFFGVAFEIWFQPADVKKQRYMLLRRCYKVQAYDPPTSDTTP